MAQMNVFCIITDVCLLIAAAAADVAAAAEVDELLAPYALDSTYHCVMLRH
jgi:hypothetical protein